MGRFGHMMIYFAKKWGRFGRGCLGKGGVLVGVALVMGRFDMYSSPPLLSVHEVNRGTLNILINIMKIRYLRLTFA